MASSLQSFEPRVAPREYSVLQRPAYDDHSTPRWEMRIRFGQVIVLWAVLAGMMVMVFMFGFHAGREQGLSRALHQAESEAVRLPIAKPIPDGSNPELAASEQSQKFSETSTNDAEDQEFDFSRSEKIATPEAGLSSKPALELFKPDEKTTKNPASDASESIAAIENERKKQALIKEAEELTVALKQKKETEEKVVEAKATQTDDSLSQLSPPLKPEVTKKAAVSVVDSKPKAEAAATTTPKIREQREEELSGGWYVQAAATRSKQDAVAMVTKFSEKGLHGVLEQAKVRKKEYYRVLVGPYPNKDAALAARSDVKSAGITGGEPFLKHVK